MNGNDYNAGYWGSQSLSASESFPSSSQCAESADASAYRAASQGASNDAARVDDPIHNASNAQPFSYQQHPGAAPYAQRGVSAYPYVRHSGKDHVAAGLLAIFLGGLGIHKFYLGYNSVGFIMLGVTILGSIFTLGLAGLVMELIGIIEGIIYLSKDQHTFDWTYVYNVKEWF